MKNNFTKKAPLSISSPAKDLLKEAFSLADDNKFDEAIEKYNQIIAEFPDDSLTAQAYYNLGQLYEKRENLLESRKNYKALIAHFPNSKLVSSAQNKIEDLNISILFSPIITDKSVYYEVMPGDTLGEIAEEFGTTVDLLMRSNNLTDDRIFPGMKLKVCIGKFSLVVDKSQNSLALKLNEEVLKTYSVSTGFGGSTPTGTFKIVNKLMDPVWFKMGAVVPPESPENILGSRWLGLSVVGYGIHGTTEPETVGKAITKGCIRMHNKDVEELYTILPIGTEVTIIE
jgi:LysM repeat protein